MQKPIKKEKKLFSFRHYVFYRENNEDNSQDFDNNPVSKGDIDTIAMAISRALSSHKNKTIEFLRKLNDEKINAILDKMNATELNKTSFNQFSSETEGDILSPNLADSAGE
jgi:hypothetical protein